MNKSFSKYKEGILYLIFGCIATIISIASYTIINVSFGINELVANVVSWILAVSFQFVTNRTWVFESHTASIEEFMKQMAAFFGGRVFTLLVEEVLIFVFVTVFHMNGVLIKTAAQVVIIVLNYLISKFIIFKKS